MRGQVPGRVEKGGRFNFFRRCLFFLAVVFGFWCFLLGVRVKGRKEWAQDEGCVGRSRVASKRVGVLYFIGRFWLMCGVGCWRSSAVLWGVGGGRSRAGRGMCFDATIRAEESREPGREMPKVKRKTEGMCL